MAAMPVESPGQDFEAEQLCWMDSGDSSEVEKTYHARSGVVCCWWCCRWAMPSNRSGEALSARNG